MGKYKKLEKERRDILLDMNSEEVESYFKNIIKKFFKNIPEITDEGNYKYSDEKELLKIQKNFNESLNLLEPKWNNLRTFCSNEIETEWVHKYKNSLINYESYKERKNDNIRNLIIMEEVQRLQYSLGSLRLHFNILHLINHYKILDFIVMLEVAKCSDEEIKQIILNLKEDYYYDNPKYYDNRLNHYFNELIKELVEEIEDSVKNFNLLIEKWNVKEGDVEDFEKLKKEYPEELETIESYETFYRSYNMGCFFVDYYEWFKENPFIEANDFILINNIYDETGCYMEGTVKQLKEEIKASGNEGALKEIEELEESLFINLKYDFTNFKIIVPEEDKSKGSS